MDESFNHHMSIARQHLTRAHACANAGNYAAASRAIADGLAQVMAARRPIAVRRDAAATDAVRAIRRELYTLEFHVKNSRPMPKI